MMKQIHNKLFSLQDTQYRDFHARLMPTVDKATIIGVRTPLVKQLAKQLQNNADVNEFLSCLPHRYYEENNLHAFLINGLDRFDATVEQLDRFLPFVDNWATCDGLRPKAFAKNRDKLDAVIERWLDSNHIYTVRFGIEMLMVHFLDEDFDTKYLYRVSTIRSDAYYINMMIAWYFATALAKQWDSTLPILEQRQLSKWVHNKTIQKALESYRITSAQKQYLREMKR